MENCKLNAFDKAAALLKTEPKVWLVTGVAGFIGSNLLEALLRLNQRVIGLDNYATGTWQNLQQVRDLVGTRRWKNFRQIDADITNAPTCVRVSRGVDFVLHEAALGSVPRSVASPVESHSSNVTGTLNLLVAARDQKIRRFVFASSSSVYGDSPELPKREDNTGSCLSPYAATKMAGEIYASVFARCYGLETVCLRYFNVFGPRQDPDGPYAAVIPKWIKALMANDPIVIYGDGETTRDFCYVANVVQANILAATVENPRAINQAYNVAVNARTSLNRLFALLRDNLVPYYAHLERVKPLYQAFRPADIPHSQADVSKARKLLGYAPSHNLEKGLSEALNWYRANLADRSGPKPARFAKPHAAGAACNKC
jgi:UDP-N-acetylglucosamine 4-epimerase